jgi:hypothetical protein
MAQTRFEIPELWTVGSMDVALDLRPDWKSVLPMDVKGKDHEVVSLMRVGAKSYDPDHYPQIQGYIWACRTFHEEMGWADMGLEPAEGGIVMYASRQRPRWNKEFYFPYNEEFALQAMERLHDMKSFFEDGILPPREKEWRWTESPCDWCPFKKYACKPDIKADVSSLDQSSAIQFATGINQAYDYSKVREKVFSRWEQTTKEREEAA